MKVPGVQLQRPAKAFERFTGVGVGSKSIAEIVVCVSLAGIQPHRFLIGSYGLGEAVLPFPQSAEAVVKLRAVFQRDRVLQTSFRFFKPFQAS